MAIKLPEGSQVSFSTTQSAPIKIVDTSNEAPPFATLSGDITVKTGDVIVVNSNWSLINDVVAVAGQLTDDHKLRLLGHDTSDTFFCSPGEGSGSVRAVSGWVAFDQINEVSASGGEQKFYTYSHLNDPTGREHQIPTSKSAVTLTFKLHYDPAQSWYDAAKRVSFQRKPVVLRIKLPDRDVIYHYGYLSMDGNPSLTKEQGMEVSATLSTQCEHILIPAA